VPPQSWHKVLPVKFPNVFFDVLERLYDWHSTFSVFIILQCGKISSKELALFESSNGLSIRRSLITLLM
jgi:hypothetical protein